MKLLLLVWKYGSMSHLREQNAVSSYDRMSTVPTLAGISEIHSGYSAATMFGICFLLPVAMILCSLRSPIPGKVTLSY